MINTEILTINQLFINNITNTWLHIISMHTAYLLTAYQNQNRKTDFSKNASRKRMLFTFKVFLLKEIRYVNEPQT